MHKQIRQVVENSHLFQGLRPDLIKRIAGSATRRTLGPGEILFQKGDPADALWGVLSGRIVLGVATEDGKEMTLDVFGKGEVFGEVGVLDFGPRLEEARATEKTELFRLERKRFLRHLQRSPELCFRVFSLLCSHVRGATENLEDTALYELHNRLAKRLLLLGEDSDKDNGSTVRIAQSELASMLGVHRQAVNRHLRQFESDGLIALHRQRIEILDAQALSNIASPGQTRHEGAWGTENLAILEHPVFRQASQEEDRPRQAQRHTAGLMAIDAAEYSRSLMTDAAETLKRIEIGLSAVDRAIEQHQGHTVWHTGDRVLAEFPDARLAMRAALAIQEQVDPQNRKDRQESLFRIGVHHGEVMADNRHVLGNAVNTAIRLTQFAGAGGIAISGAVRDAIPNREQLDLHYLGEHELMNVAGTVPVYSARAMPWVKRLALRAETLVPRRHRPAVVAMAAVVLVAGIWFAGDWRGRKSAPIEVSQLSIAVLPFSNGDESTLDYLAEGLPEELRRGLSIIPGMRIIGRESSGYFSERPASVEQMGRAFEVAWLLQGSVEVAADGILTTTQLFNTVSSEVVWEQSFKASEGDVINLTPEIVLGVAASLGITESEGSGLPLLAPMTRNPEAQALYMKAQSHWWLGRQRYSIKAIPLLQSAVELDPTFAEAHAFLALGYRGLNLLDLQDEFNPELRAELARKSLQQALLLKPDSPRVLAAAANMRMTDEDYEGAQALTERALRIDPNNTQALRNLALIQRNQEDLGGALQTVKRWVSLEPMAIGAMNAYRSLLGQFGRHEESLAVANRVLALYPEQEVRQVHAWAASDKLLLGDRIGAIESARLASPFALPIDLWTGLDHDFDVVDDVVPVLSAQSFVYVENYDQVRQILNDWWEIEDPEFDMANDLDYLINRGELEALAGNHESSVEFFEQARLLGPPDEDGGLVGIDFGMNVLDWSRQSYFPLAMLHAYRKTARHGKAQVIASQWEDMIRDETESAAKTGKIFRRYYKKAQFHAIENRPAEALKMLRAWTDHGTAIFTYVRWDPLLENLHGNPEFEALVAEVEAELANIRKQFHDGQAELAQTSDG
jgi:adenylate cyclase